MWKYKLWFSISYQASYNGFNSVSTLLMSSKLNKWQPRKLLEGSGFNFLLSMLMQISYYCTNTFFSMLGEIYIRDRNGSLSLFVKIQSNKFFMLKTEMLNLQPPSPAVQKWDIQSNKSFMVMTEMLNHQPLTTTI